MCLLQDEEHFNKCHNLGQEGNTSDIQFLWYPPVPEGNSTGDLVRKSKGPICQQLHYKDQKNTTTQLTSILPKQFSHLSVRKIIGKSFLLN